MTAPINNNVVSTNNFSSNDSDLEEFNENDSMIARQNDLVITHLEIKTTEQIVSDLHKSDETGLKKTIEDSKSHGFDPTVCLPVNYKVCVAQLEIFFDEDVLLENFEMHPLITETSSSADIKKGIFNKVTGILTPTIEDSKEVRAQLGCAPKTVMRNAKGEEREIDATLGVPIEAERMREFERAYVTFLVASRILKDMQKNVDEVRKKAEEERKRAEEKRKYAEEVQRTKNAEIIKELTKPKVPRENTKYTDEKVNFIKVQFFKKQTAEIQTLNKKRRVQIVSEKAYECDGKKNYVTKDIQNTMILKEEVLKRKKQKR